MDLKMSARTQDAVVAELCKLFCHYGNDNPKVRDLLAELTLLVNGPPEAPEAPEDSQGRTMVADVAGDGRNDATEEEVEETEVVEEAAEEEETETSDEDEVE